MTYSIVGRDAETGELGVAVQSQAFNTGAAVPWAWPGVGAVATQSFTDRRYGWRGLELMAEGASAADALDGLRADDELADFRQVGMMSADGRTSQWTGAHCVPSAGGAAGEGWIAQANMVESPRVWEAMGEAFEATTGPLAVRLLAALDAARRKAATGAGGAAPGSSSSRSRASAGSASSTSASRKATRRSRAASPARARARLPRGEPGVGGIERRGRAAAAVCRSSTSSSARSTTRSSRDRPDEAARILAELEARDPRWRDVARTVAKLPEMGALARLPGRPGS